MEQGGGRGKESGGPASVMALVPFSFQSAGGNPDWTTHVFERRCKGLSITELEQICKAAGNSSGQPISGHADVLRGRVRLAHVPGGALLRNWLAGWRLVFAPAWLLPPESPATRPVRLRRPGRLGPACPPGVREVPGHAPFLCLILLRVDGCVARCCCVRERCKHRYT